MGDAARLSCESARGSTELKVFEGSGWGGSAALEAETGPGGWPRGWTSGVSGYSCVSGLFAVMNGGPGGWPAAGIAWRFSNLLGRVCALNFDDVGKRFPIYSQDLALQIHAVWWLRTVSCFDLRSGDASRAWISGVDPAAESLRPVAR